MFGSVVHPQRFKQLAFVANRLWVNIPTDSDYVLVVESDLIWSASTLTSLLNDVEAIRFFGSGGSGGNILAPLVIGPDDLFYDVWAFRVDGRNFTKEWPYHSNLKNYPILEIDSVGSCALMDYKLARKLTWPEEDLFVGLCRQARELGAMVIVDSKLRVYHP